MSSRIKPLKSLKEAEKEFKLKVDEPFFTIDGVSLTAINGYEAPHVVLRTVEGTEILLNHESIIPFVRAFQKAREWCEDGWTDGMQ